jgi:hypothetical protein
MKSPLNYRDLLEGEGGSATHFDLLLPQRHALRVAGQQHGAQLLLHLLNRMLIDHSREWGQGAIAPRSRYLVQRRRELRLDAVSVARVHLGASRRSHVQRLRVGERE